MFVYDILSFFALIPNDCHILLMLLIMLQAIYGYNGSSLRNFIYSGQHFLILNFPWMHHCALIPKDLKSEDLIACLIKDILWNFRIIIIKIDHDLIIEMAKHWCDRNNSNDIDIGVDPRAYISCQFFPWFFLAKVLIFYKSFLTLHAVLIIVKYLELYEYCIEESLLLKKFNFYSNNQIVRYLARFKNSYCKIYASINW